MAPSVSAAAKKASAPPPPAVCVSDLVLNGADSSGLLKLTAVGGRLDARLRLEFAPGTAAASPPATAQVRVALLGDPDDRHGLRLFDAERAPVAEHRAEAGAALDGIAVPGGSYHLLGIVGIGFEPGVSSFVRVLVTGCRTRSFVLEIQSQMAPLGLLASELQPEPQSVWPFRRSGVTFCLPVESPAGTRFQWIYAGGTLVDGEKLLPRENLHVRWASASDQCPMPSLFFVVGALEAGRYVAKLTINGQDLTVRVIFRNGFVWVVLIVTIGAALSTIAQAIMKLSNAKASNETLISDAERVVKSSGGLFLWDNLRADNALRRARACNQRFLLPEVAAAVASAKEPPPLRTGLDDVYKVAFGSGLPLAVLKQLDWEIRFLRGIANLEDARGIPGQIAVLQGEAKSLFRGRVVAWLGTLRAAAEALIGELRATLRAPAWDAQRAEGNGALDVLERLMKEADQVFATSSDQKLAQLEPTHADLLARVVPCLKAMQSWLAGGPRIDLRAILHGRVAELPPPQSTQEGPTLPAMSPVAVQKRAPKDVTTGIDVDLGVTAPANAELRYVWTIARKRALRAGTEPPVPIESYTPVLTYVFQTRGTYQVAVSLQSQQGTGAGTTLSKGRLDLKVRRYDSSLRTHQKWNFMAKLGVSGVGVVIASAVAVGIFWSDKGFGSWRDYVAVLGTGLGADVGLGASGSLLQAIRTSLTGKNDAPKSS
jgi:hypothetical protein